MRKKFAATCKVFCRQANSFIAKKVIRLGNAAGGDMGNFFTGGVFFPAVFKKDIAGINQQGGKTFFFCVLFGKRYITGFAGQTAQPITASTAGLIFALEIIGKEQRELLRPRLREYHKWRRQDNYQ